MNLSPNEIHLWQAHCFASLDDTQLSAYRALLTADEEQRLQRFCLPGDRQRYLIARALVRHTLSRYTESLGRPVAPADWRFVKGEHDKPEIADGPLPLRFNLSHSGDYAVCAVALETDVGVDIECTTRTNDIQSIARHYFSVAELYDLRALEPAEARQRFFDLWTLKEAFMKARGEGISLGLGNFSFAFEQGGGIGVAFADVLRDNPLDWQFWLHDPAPSYRVGLAWHRGTGWAEPRIRLFDAVPGYRSEALVWRPTRSTAMAD